MLKCSTCNLRFKGVILNRCGHLFCKECVDARLNVRARKCPTCQAPFGKDDVSSVSFSFFFFLLYFFVLYFFRSRVALKVSLLTYLFISISPLGLLLIVFSSVVSFSFGVFLFCPFFSFSFAFIVLSLSTLFRVSLLVLFGTHTH